MSEKLKRVRFRKDGKLDIEYETEDGRTEIAEGCTLHIDTDPNSGDEFPVTFTVHGGEQHLIKGTMRKYHVAVEQIPNSSIMGMFGGPMGFSVIYFTCEIPEGQPVNRDTLYELINRERDEKHKTGNVIAWSKIETE